MTLGPLGFFCLRLFYMESPSIHHWANSGFPSLALVPVMVSASGFLLEQVVILCICPLVSSIWWHWLALWLHFSLKNLRRAVDFSVCSTHHLLLRWSDRLHKKPEAPFFFSFIFISWRLITLQHCSGFCHTLKWISHGFTCVPHPDPPSPDRKSVV